MTTTDERPVVHCMRISGDDGGVHEPHDWHAPIYRADGDVRCPGSALVNGRLIRRDREAGSATTDLLFAFLVCLLIGLATVSLVVMGRAVMCDIHADALSYCPGFEATR